MNRPELQRMLKDAKEGNIDCVMVYKTNRLALIHLIFSKLSKIYTNKMSNFSVCQSVWKSILLLVNSCYRYLRVSQNSKSSNIVENVFMGQTRRAQEGYYQGNLPLGYDKIPDSKHELMINQHEANIVKYIFECYAKGHGYRKIANASNHKDMSLKKGETFQY